ncbi:MAG TPA: hypothetical protein VMM12_17235 [Longimicrobiales bacterium]|nr:hypothetical protein [Longimicrobiales bacterium]
MDRFQGQMRLANGLCRFGSGGGSPAAEEFRRVYTTRVVWQRMHQASFRDRVLRAYRESCSVCQLGHAELLDAAHILPDHQDELAIKGLE